MALVSDKRQLSTYASKRIKRKAEYNYFNSYYKELQELNTTNDEEQYIDRDESYPGNYNYQTPSYKYANNITPLQISHNADVTSSYRIFIPLLTYCNMSYTNSLASKKVPLFARTPALIDFGGMNFISNCLRTKKEGAKVGMGFGASILSYNKRTLSAYYAKALSRKDEIYLNPFDYKFYRISDNSLVREKAPEADNIFPKSDEIIPATDTQAAYFNSPREFYKWHDTQLGRKTGNDLYNMFIKVKNNFFNSYKNTYTYRNEKTIRNNLSNFNFYGTKAYVPKYTENITKRNNYFKAILTNNNIEYSDILGYKDITWSRDCMDWNEQYILQEVLLDYWQYREDKFFQLNGNLYKVNLDYFCFDLYEEQEISEEQEIEVEEEVEEEQEDGTIIIKKVLVKKTIIVTRKELVYSKPVDSLPVFNNDGSLKHIIVIQELKYTDSLKHTLNSNDLAIIQKIKNYFKSPNVASQANAYAEQFTSLAIREPKLTDRLFFMNFEGGLNRDELSIFTFFNNVGNKPRVKEYFYMGNDVHTAESPWVQFDSGATIEKTYAGFTVDEPIKAVPNYTPIKYHFLLYTPYKSMNISITGDYSFAHSMVGRDNEMTIQQYNSSGQLVSQKVALPRDPIRSATKSFTFSWSGTLYDLLNNYLNINYSYSFSIESAEATTTDANNYRLWVNLNHKTAERVIQNFVNYQNFFVNSLSNFRVRYFQSEGQSATSRNDAENAYYTIATQNYTGRLYLHLPSIEERARVNITASCGEYSGETFYEHKNGQIWHYSQYNAAGLEDNLDKYEDGRMLLLLFGILSNTDSYDYSEYSTSPDNKTHWVYFYDFQFREAGAHYDRVRLMPLFVIDGIYNNSNILLSNEGYQYDKKVITENEAYGTEAWNIDNYDDFFKVSQSQYQYNYRNTLIDTKCSYDFYYSSPKDRSKFRLPERWVLIYSYINYIIEEIKNHETSSFYIQYKDKNGNIRLYWHTEEYSSFMQNISDTSYRLIDILPTIIFMTSIRNVYAIKWKGAIKGGTGINGILQTIGEIFLSFFGLFTPAVWHFYLIEQKYYINNLKNVYGYDKLTEAQKEEIEKYNVYVAYYGEGLQPMTTLFFSFPNHRIIYLKQNRYIQYYFKNSFNFLLKEWDEYTSPYWEENLDKNGDIKDPKRRVTEENSVIYTPPILKQESPSTDLNDFTSKKKHIDHGDVTSVFSFSIFLNRTVRRTKLLCKFAYKMLQYYWEEYATDAERDASTWICLDLYPPDREQFSEKHVILKFRKGEYDNKKYKFFTSFQASFNPVTEYLTFFNQQQGLYFQLDFKIYAPNWQKYYCNNKKEAFINDIAEDILESDIDAESYIYKDIMNHEFSRYDISQKDILLNKTADVLYAEDGVKPNKTKFQYLEGRYIYNVFSIYYMTGITYNWKDINGTIHEKKAKIKWKNYRAIWQLFYTPHEQDMANYTFDDKLAPSVNQDLLYEYRNVCAWMIRQLRNKTIEELEILYKKIFNKDVNILRKNNIFNYSGMMDNFLEPFYENEAREYFLKTQGDTSFVLRKYRLKLDTRIDSALIATVGNTTTWGGNTNITVLGINNYPYTDNHLWRTYYQWGNSDGSIDVSMFAQTTNESTNNTNNQNTRINIQQKSGYNCYKDIRTISFLQSMHFAICYDNDLILTFPDSEGYLNDYDACKQLTAYFVSNFLPKTKVLHYLDWPKYFVIDEMSEEALDIDKGLRAAFNDYEIYQIGFNNFLVTNDDIAIWDSSLNILFDSLNEIDNNLYTDIQYSDENNSLKGFVVFSTLIPVPMKVYARNSYYSKKFLANVMTRIMYRARMYGGFLAVESSKNLSRYIAAKIMQIIATLIGSLFLMVLTGGTTGASSVMAFTAVLQVVSAVIQIMALLTNDDAKYERLMRLSQGINTTAGIIGIFGGISSIGNIGASITTLQGLANIAMSITSVTFGILTAINNFNTEKKINQLKNEYNTLIDEYNKKTDEMNELIEKYEFEGILADNAYFPVKLGVEGFENLLAVNFDIDAIYETYIDGALNEMYTELDTYYDDLMNNLIKRSI